MRMRAIELARFLLMYPDATVYIDNGGKRGTKPMRFVDLKKSTEKSNDHYAVIVVTDFGYERG